MAYLLVSPLEGEKEGEGKWEAKEGLSGREPPAEAEASLGVCGA